MGAKGPRAQAPGERGGLLDPSFLPAHSILAGCYAELGRQAEAAEVRRLDPQFSFERRRPMLPYKDPAMLERFFSAQRKAGLQ